LPSLAETIEDLRAEIGVESSVHTAVIEADAVERFENAIGAPRRTDSSGAPIAPPTFVTRLIAYHRPEWYERLGFVGLLLTGEEATFHQPMVVGDRVSWTWRLESIVAKTRRDGQRMWFITTHYGFSSEGNGSPVVDVRRTFVILDRA
jgi:acyl dehydratase